ncbi:MAG: cytochrome c3 family protein [Candidatus Aminicenantaceae bacterium]
MTPRRVLAFAAVLLAAVLAPWTLQTQDDPHEFEGKCDMCHLGLKDPSILIRSPNRLCLSCHPDGEKRSHPSGFTPSMTLPEQFPLFGNEMVCETCHFPHRQYGRDQGAGEAVQPGPFLLRAESAGKLFCYICHQGEFSSFEVDSHALAVKRAHLAPLDYESLDMLDDNSKDCLSCHDGTLSSASDIQLRGLNFEHPTDIGLSHPVGMDYAQVYAQNPNTFHPPESIDPRIVLAQGRVGCESCHDHYSGNPKYLVMDNTMSRLCLSCHDL